MYVNFICVPWGWTAGVSGRGADKSQAPESLNAFRSEGGRSDVLCGRQVLGAGRSTSGYKACSFVASKLGLTPSSDVVVALVAAETAVAISYHVCLTDANLGGFLPSPYNITSLSFTALMSIAVSSAVNRSWRAPGKSAIILAIRHGTSAPYF